MNLVVSTDTKTPSNDGFFPFDVSMFQTRTWSISFAATASTGRDIHTFLGFLERFIGDSVGNLLKLMTSIA